jgi:hypothetical protein
MSSIDVSSNEETEPRVTEIAAPEMAISRLESSETFDDVDEDEAFINDLMAMHPNDDDLVIEDLDTVSIIVTAPENLDDIPIIVTTPEDVIEGTDADTLEGEEAVEEGVRQT